MLSLLFASFSSAMTSGDRDNSGDNGSSSSSFSSSVSSPLSSFSVKHHPPLLKFVLLFSLKISSNNLVVLLSFSYLFPFVLSISLRFNKSISTSHALVSPHRPLETSPHVLNLLFGILHARTHSYFLHPPRFKNDRINRLRV